MGYLVFRVLGKWIGYLPSVARYIPLGISGIFILTQFFIDWFMENMSFAVAHASKTVFGSELAINTAVHAAIIDAPEYNLGMFLGKIVVSTLILYSLIFGFGKLIRKSLGANMSFGEVIISAFIVAILSAASIRIIDGVWGFIPIKDSLYFLFSNINPVLHNIW